MIGVVAILGSVPAHAADVVFEEPVPPAAPMEQPPLNTWSGPYAGVMLGYGFNGRTRAPGNTVNTDGFIGSGFAGYNYQDGMFVAGVEADVGYAGLRGANAGLSSRSSLDGSLRARMGIAVTDDILIYGTGGGALQNLRISNAAGSDSNTMLGYTVGAGVDVKVTENVFGRVEYRYTDFGNRGFNLGGATQSVDTSDNRVMFGVGMKF
ncbi:MAG: outer membrane protein [Rhizobiaceae bacterium]